MSATASDRGIRVMNVDAALRAFGAVYAAEPGEDSVAALWRALELELTSGDNPTPKSGIYRRLAGGLASMGQPEPHFELCEIVREGTLLKADPAWIGADALSGAVRSLRLFWYHHGLQTDETYDPYCFHVDAHVRVAEDEGRQRIEIPRCTLTVVDSGSPETPDAEVVLAFTGEVVGTLLTEHIRDLLAEDASPSRPPYLDPPVMLAEFLDDEAHSDFHREESPGS